MKHQLPKYVDAKKVEKFLSIKGKKIIVYDADPDGITSATLLMKFYPGFEAKPKRGPGVGEEFSRLLTSLKPDLLVFLDMAMDHEWGSIRKIKELGGTKFIIIDHHLPRKNLSSRNIVHINPLFEKDAYIPTSYLTYLLMEALGKDVKKYMWIALMGTIADYAFKSCRGFIDEGRKAYPHLLKGDAKKSRMRKGIRLISSSITINGLRGASDSLKRLISVDSFEKLEEMKELKELGILVETEFKRLMGLFVKEREVHQRLGLIMYEIRSPMSLMSEVSTAVSELNQNKVVVIRKRADDGWKISARCQSGRVNVADLLKACSRGIGSGGGHKKAAGAYVSDWGKFRARLLKRLEQQKA